MFIFASHGGRKDLPPPHPPVWQCVDAALRWSFERDAKRLQALFEEAWRVMAAWLRERSGAPDGQAAMVDVVHMFGDYLVFHPHVHARVAWGVWDEAGVFHRAPPPG